MKKFILSLLVIVLSQTILSSVSYAQESGFDCTELLINPNFDEGMENNAPIGWILEGEGTPQSKISSAAKGDGVIADSHWQLWKNSAYNGRAYQIVENLPNGTYTVAVAVVSSFSGDSVSVYANEESTEVTSNENRVYSVQVHVSEGTLELGLKFDVESATIDFDSFTLFCDVLDEDDELAVYKQAMENAFHELEDYAAELEENEFAKICEQMMIEAEDIYYPAHDSDEEQVVLDAIEAIKGIIASNKEHMGIIDKIKKLIVKAENMCEATEYPGSNTFVEAINKADNTLIDSNLYTLNEFGQTYDELCKAIFDYP